MKTLWCALLVCAAHAVWTWPALADPSALPELPELRMPPQGQRQAWPRNLRLNGVPVAVRIYEWPVALADALDRVVGQFDDEVLLRPHRGGWLMSPRDGPAWVLTLQEAAPDRTLLVLSAWNGLMPARRHQAGSPPGWLPPGGNLRLDLEEGGVASTGVTTIAIYTYAERTPMALAHDLERELSRHGWRRGGAPGYSTWLRDGVRVDFVTVPHAQGSALLMQQHARAERSEARP